MDGLLTRNIGWMSLIGQLKNCLDSIGAEFHKIFWPGINLNLWEACAIFADWSSTKLQERDVGGT